MLTIGIDVGGTFTDLVLYDSERQTIAVHKTSTTPSDPTIGMIRGLQELLATAGHEPADVTYLMHGTTIATNAVLEHKGATVGMVTTAGYKDIIHIGRHQRPENYSIVQDIPWQFQPLAPRHLRFGVRERLAPPAGAVVTPLAVDDVRAAAEQLKAAGVEAVAVCFLFSYLDPRHELEAKALLEEYLGDRFICTSAEVSPQFREFERFTTTALNAFVGPKMRHYVTHLGNAVSEAGYGAPVHIMKSNGGLATAGQVARMPVTTLLSGPAAGVIAGRWLGEQVDRQHLITFDVGGTSADIGIITPHGIVEASARDTVIAGYPVMVPMIDIHTIGAGGGSIAYVDSGGALRVGPESAGAEPGPACYGRGGTRPTVTDAYVELGYLPPDHFLGGAMTLDPDKSHAVLASLGEQLAMSAHQVARGIVTIVNHNMANAIQSRTVQKGHDPRSFSLVAFGGAGGLSAVDVARILGIPEVIVPLYPGITSAIGLTTTGLRYDVSRTEFMVPDTLDLDRLSRDFLALEQQLVDQFAADGLGPDAIRFEWALDCRYVGQGYELRVPAPRQTQWSSETLGQLHTQFHRQHELEYGHAFFKSPIEIVNIRVTGIGDIPTLTRLPFEPDGSAGTAPATQTAWFDVDGALAARPTHIIDRRSLPAGHRVAGPAILYQHDATTVIPPGGEAVVHPTGHILIQVGGD